MSSLLIRNTSLQDEVVDILIQGQRFARIGPELQVNADRIIDGRGTAIVPPLFNAHTHAAMTLLRGYADDMELSTWLNSYIWPLEARLQPEDVYIGTKLACLEMIKSGTIFFNDMYWHFQATAQAVLDMGLRAALSSVFIDFNDPNMARKRWEECLDLLAWSQDLPSRITFALGPHAVYSVSRESLCQARDLAQKHGLFIHLHVSETAQEVEDCVQKTGRRPVEYLHDLGLLGPNLLACHALWLSPQEMDLLAENQVTVVHNPVSNLKLGSGLLPFRALDDRGIKVVLGTDGCSSNNSLDMLESMKYASLLAKGQDHDPTAFPAHQAYAAASSMPAQIFGIDSGTIAEGHLADCLLIDLEQAPMTPSHNLISNLVYSAKPECVHSTICDGALLMHARRVQGEAEILAQARKSAQRLVRSQKSPPHEKG